MKYQLPLVIYDPACPLCLRFKQGLEYLNKDLNFAAVDEEGLYQSFPQLSPAACQAQVHLLTEDQGLLVGPEVVDYLIQSLPGIGKLAWLLDHEQGRKVKDYFYQKVEELRELARKEPDCPQCPRK